MPPCLHQCKAPLVRCHEQVSADQQFVALPSPPPEGWSASRALGVEHNIEGLQRAIDAVREGDAAAASEE